MPWVLFVLCFVLFLSVKQVPDVAFYENSTNSTEKQSFQPFSIGNFFYRFISFNTIYTIYTIYIELYALCLVLPPQKQYKNSTFLQKQYTASLDLRYNLFGGGHLLAADGTRSCCDQCKYLGVELESINVARDEILSGLSGLIGSCLSLRHLTLSDVDEVKSMLRPSLFGKISMLSSTLDRVRAELPINQAFQKEMRADCSQEKCRCMASLSQLANRNGFAWAFIAAACRNTAVTLQTFLNKMKPFDVYCFKNISACFVLSVICIVLRCDLYYFVLFCAILCCNLCIQSQKTR